MEKGLKIFITYAHKNSDAKDELITSLAVLKQNGLIDVWYDNEILPGDKWRDEIFNNLADSDILLYLTCRYSLASENCNKELTAALNPNIRVIPIILEHCDWQNHQLSDFQALPDKGKPINEWQPESKGWQNAVDGVRKAVCEMQSQAKPSPNITPEEIETLAFLAFHRGNFMMILGQIDEALKDYSRAIELSPNNAAAYTNRGIIYSEKGEFDLAIKDYFSALKINPDSTNAYNNRGNAYTNINEIDFAIQDYTKAIQLKPDFACAYTCRGLAYIRKNELDLAISDLNKSIELDPELAVAYVNRGLFYLRKRDLNPAIQDFTLAIELDPELAVAYVNRGSAYHEKRNFEQAIKDLNIAIELNPNYAEAHFNRGNVYQEKGDVDMAIADYTTAIQLQFDDASFYYNRGNAYQSKEDYISAIQDFSTAINLYPEFVEAYVNRGTVYRIVGHFDLAIEDQTKAIHLDPNDAEAYNNRGLVYLHNGNVDLAIQDFNTAIQHQSKLVSAYVNRGVAYLMENKVDLSIADYTKAIALSPETALIYYNRGAARLILKEWQKAKTDLITAKDKGLDIIASFHNTHGNVETYEKRHRVKLPEDIALLLTERRRTRYPKTRPFLDTEGNPIESPDVVNLREQLRNAGRPLSDYINAKSVFGINTAPTEVFVVNKETRDKLIAAHPTSVDILKSFLHGQDIRRWHVDTPQQWLIFTHRGITINDYPAILKYLEKHKEPLSKRKGKQEWYELPASLKDAERFAQPKLVCPNTYNHQTFAVDTAGYYYGNTSYLIPTEEKWLCGLLNSRTVEWFYSQVSKQLTIDPLRARSGYIQQIPIPDITPVHKALIAKIVDYLIFLQQQPEINSEDLKYSRDRIMLGYFERVIDGLVYEAYLPEELHKSDKVFLQPLLDEQLPSIEDIQGDKMSAIRDIFELLYDRMHLVRRHLYYLDVIKPIRIIQGKL